MIKTITIGIFLTIQVFWDIKTKKLPFIVTLVGCITGFFFMCIQKEVSMFSMVSFVPAVVCFLFAKVSKEAIGYGDVFLICMLGFYYSITEIIIICQIAFTITAIIALVLLIFFRKKKSYEIPFAPFLLMGFLIEEVCI